MITFKIDTVRLQKTIFDTLQNLGFSGEHTGYRYVTEYLSYKFDLYVTNNTRHVQIQEWYKTMADKYNTSPASIARALQTVIREAVASNSHELTNIFSESALRNGSFESNKNFLEGVYQYLLANCVSLGFGFNESDADESKGDDI